MFLFYKEGRKILSRSRKKMRKRYNQIKMSINYFVKPDQITQNYTGYDSQPILTPFNLLPIQ